MTIGSKIGEFFSLFQISDRKAERLKNELDELKKQGNQDSKSNKNNKEVDAQTKHLIARLQNELKQKVIRIEIY